MKNFSFTFDFQTAVSFMETNTANMKKLLILTGIIIFIISALSFQNAQHTIQVKQTSADTLAEERERFTNEILATVKGKEAGMADSVFKNIKTFGGKESLKVTHLSCRDELLGRSTGNKLHALS